MTKCPGILLANLQSRDRPKFPLPKAKEKCLIEVHILNIHNRAEALLELLRLRCQHRPFRISQAVWNIFQYDVYVPLSLFIARCPKKLNAWHSYRNCCRMPYLLMVVFWSPWSRVSQLWWDFWPANDLSFAANPPGNLPSILSTKSEQLIEDLTRFDVPEIFLSVANWHGARRIRNTSRALNSKILPTKVFRDYTRAFRNQVRCKVPIISRALKVVEVRALHQLSIAILVHAVHAQVPPRWWRRSFLRPPRPALSRWPRKPHISRWNQPLHPALKSFISLNPFIFLL